MKACFTNARQNRMLHPIYLLSSLGSYSPSVVRVVSEDVGRGSQVGDYVQPNDMTEGRLIQRVFLRSLD